MNKLTAMLERPYDIFIGEGLLDNLTEHIKPTAQGKRVFIVSDSNVAPIYLHSAKQQLCGCYEISCHIFPAGEASKTLDTISALLGAMARAHLTREDTVIALGGGVVGDMAGFAAAIYMRGISFIQLSTSLLSAVDSSVGGKTGCDLPEGKNLVGAFHQPTLVLIDTNTLKTLPKRFYNDGMGEVIKYGAIGSAPLLQTITAADELDIAQLITECVQMKLQLVQQDEREQGVRRLLNFGHTLGHAVEKYYEYEKYSHGEAVGIGMYLITAAAERAALSEAGTAEQIKRALQRYSLPYCCDAGLDRLCEIATSDKKCRADSIDLVIADKIGSAKTVRMKTNELYAFLKD